MHQVILCFFVIALSVCVYPVFLRVPIEITPVFGKIEADLFSWYRMWLLFGVSCIFIFSKKWFSKSTLLFFFLVALSSYFSQFFRTSLFGSPWMHEGFFAIVGYGCIYLAAKNVGMSRRLEKSLDAVIVILFLLGIYQLFLNSLPILLLFPDMEYSAEVGSFYSTLGCSNNVGLFCALMFPYVLYRRKFVLTAMVLFMAVASLTRGAWLAIACTSLFLDRKAKAGMLLCLFLALPFYKHWYPRLEQSFQDLSFPIQDSAFSGRAYMWKEGIAQMKETYFLGNGPGTFGLYFPQKQQRGRDIGFDGLVIDRPHSLFINVWTGSGFLSLILLLCMLGKVIIPAKEIGLKAGCIGFLIAGLFTDSVLSVTPYFMIFLGVLSHRGR